MKVRLYRRGCNSGNIGNVKNEAISLCRGKYILEFDHDDEILPDTLRESAHVFETYKDVGFVYFDFINIYEDGKTYISCMYDWSDVEEKIEYVLSNYIEFYKCIVMLHFTCMLICDNGDNNNNDDNDYNNDDADAAVNNYK